MLVIDRKTGTSVIITTPSGEECKVTVIGNSQHGIKLGFDAPQSIKITREEIHHKPKK